MVIGLPSVVVVVVVVADARRVIARRGRPSSDAAARHKSPIKKGKAKRSLAPKRGSLPTDHEGTFLCPPSVKD